MTWLKMGHQVISSSELQWLDLKWDNLKWLLVPVRVVRMTLNIYNTKYAYVFIVICFVVIMLSVRSR